MAETSVTQGKRIVTATIAVTPRSLFLLITYFIGSRFEP